MDQSGNEDRAMKQIDGKYSSKKLYDSMIEVVMDGRSPRYLFSDLFLLRYSRKSEDFLFILLSPEITSALSIIRKSGNANSELPNSDRISVPTLFAWCTFAKERLSVRELQQVWELDPSLSHDFNVLSEIQSKSKMYVHFLC